MPTVAALFVDAAPCTPCLLLIAVGALGRALTLLALLHSTAALALACHFQVWNIWLVSPFPDW
jgi:hypothetical protein